MLRRRRKSIPGMEPMTITVSSTTKIVELNGVPARVWEGKTSRGTEVHCFITRVAVHKDAPAEAVADFERDLKEQAPPSVAVDAAYPLRMIL